MTSFPEWFENAEVIGRNAANEPLAVGLNVIANPQPRGLSWLMRLSNINNQWLSVRAAVPDEIEEYDRLFLQSVGASF